MFSVAIRFFILLGLSFSVPIFAATSDATSTFVPGKVMSDFGANDYGRSVIVQADGKILVAGESAVAATMSNDGRDFALVRYNPNGSLDTSFGVGGRITTEFGTHSDFVNSVTLQADGKILVVGAAVYGLWEYTDLAMVRYNTNGSLDTSFGTNGKVTIYSDPESRALGHYTKAYSVSVNESGNILVEGEFYGGKIPYTKATPAYFVQWLYNTDGSLITDVALADSSVVGKSFTVQVDGKILMAGYKTSGKYSDIALVRYNTDGSLDAGFGTAGVTTPGFAGTNSVGTSVLIQADRKILVAGYSQNGGSNVFALVRHNPNGSLDNGFGTGGKVTTDLGFGANAFGQNLAVQPDGKILVVGYSYNGTVESNKKFALVRYNPNGSLDTSFNTNGKVTVAFGSDSSGQSVALQADGKILVAGFSYNGTNYDFAAARYNSDGSLDTTFGAVSQTPISNARVFAYVEANYPALFAGKPSDGQTTYQNTLYNYRYYPVSENYLAIDTSSVIYLIGASTGNELIVAGPVESFRSRITAWEATW